MGRTRRAGVVGAALVLLAAFATSCSCRDEKPSPLLTVSGRAWVCEACGHTFTAPNAKGLKTCPACGKEAVVRSVTYKCGKCGDYFEAWRYLDVSDVKKPKGPDGKPIEPGMYFKRKGGPWVTDEEMLGQVKCPHCGNTDPETLELTVPPAALD